VEFSHGAIEAVYQGSGGVRRVINRLCDRALERAHGAQSRHVEAEFVWNAIDELGLANGVGKRPIGASPSSAQPPVIQEASPAPTRESAGVTTSKTEMTSPLLEEFRSEAERLPIQQRQRTIATRSLSLHLPAKSARIGPSQS
jgi:hypothetical protein